MPGDRGEGEARARGISIDKLRNAAQTKVDSTSLRHVADELGMSPNGLRSFLLGGVPYSHTQHKLVNWYVRESSDSTYDVVSRDAAEAAFMVLVRHLPLNARNAAIMRLRTELASVTKSRSGRLPKWLRGLSTGSE